MDGRWDVNKLQRFAMAVAASAIFCGCSIRGPDTMQDLRIGYNKAVHASEAREVLLNLVRLRYADAPEFLEIGAISSQMNFRASASVGGDFGQVEDATSSFLTPVLGVGVGESPTVTFVPKRDREFIRRLVRQLPVQSLFSLTAYGWELDRILRLAAQDINGISNQPGREPSAEDMEDLRRFADLAERLYLAEQERQLGFALIVQEMPVVETTFVDTTLESIAAMVESGYSIQETGAGVQLYRQEQSLTLWVSPVYAGSEGFRSLAADLGVSADGARIEVRESNGLPTPADGTLRVEPRSPAAILAYLAFAVDVPPEHLLRYGLVDNRDQDSLMADLLDVRVATTLPEDAWLSVPYRGHYYYVAEDDVSSRKTLSLAGTLVMLAMQRQEGSLLPVLTLPVGR
ncbi:MAG: hypothetical protein AAGF46_08365 [Pseudomonadota bacterium]